MDTTSGGARPDFNWMVDACNGEARKLAEVALLLAAASIGEATMKTDGFFERLLHMRAVVERCYQALGKDAPPRKAQ